MKKFIIILIIGILSISGCEYINIVCEEYLSPTFCRIITCVFGEAGLENLLNNQEARQFLQAHPDAEITITLMPGKNVLKNYNTLNNEFGKLQIKDYIKLELKDGNDVLIALVDANSKQLNYIKVGMEKPESFDIEPATGTAIIEPITKPSTTKPKITAYTSRCNEDTDCPGIITYSCNSQDNPVRITNAYKCEYNKCKLSSVHETTLDLCRGNEYCEEGEKRCVSASFWNQSITSRQGRQ